MFNFDFALRSYLESEANTENSDLQNSPVARAASEWPAAGP